jgi:hypothetical protein
LRTSLSPIPVFNDRELAAERVPPTSQVSNRTELLAVVGARDRNLS